MEARRLPRARRAPCVSAQAILERRLPGQRSRRPLWLLLLALIWTPCALGAPHPVRLNEICYDPPGADAGGEFVELFNPAAQPISLEGWQLESGNGARPGDWRSAWVGTSRDRIASHGFFLVAGARVSAAADARAELHLQNGPDAVRLRDAMGRTVDLTGWGTPLDAAYAESEPAQDVPAGWVLARMPDGADSDCNAADWLARAVATPGMSNDPLWCLQLLEIGCDPPLVEPGEEAALQLLLANCGRASIDLACLQCSAAPGHLDLSRRPFAGAALDAGEIRSITTPVRIHRAGVESLTVRWSDPQGTAAEARTGLRCGRGALLISEICYDPAAGEGEWIELLNTSDAPIDLCGWTVGDASGHATRLGPAAAIVESGAHALVAESPRALRERWPELAPESCLPREGSWPSLNNGCDPERGFSDQICLRDATGCPIDCVRYRSGALDGDGVTLERWIEGRRLVEPHLLMPCAQPGGGTPGRPGWSSSDVQGDGGWLQPSPEVFYPDRPDARRYCRIRVPAPGGGDGRVSAEVYSLSGRRVATLVTGARAHGPLALTWNGCDGEGRRLASGLYLIRVVAYAPQIGRRVQLRPVTLVRG
ncbi:MAG: hypothetical protein GF330_12555 [Candidatus Eisenbacteria bacterium]|nr:hypothetical protein [Candidatus Eisenbacteria bacterium]